MGNTVINIATVIFFDGKYTQAGSKINTLCIHNSNISNVLKISKNHSLEDDGYESFLLC